MNQDQCRCVASASLIFGRRTQLSESETKPQYLVAVVLLLYRLLRWETEEVGSKTSREC
jgi:hypothetical protein